MNCSFDNSKCEGTCPKYSMCMYKSIQTQLSEINQQLNFILTTLGQISCEVGINKERINIAELDLKDLLSTIIDLTNDS